MLEFNMPRTCARLLLDNKISDDKDMNNKISDDKSNSGSVQTYRYLR